MENTVISIEHLSKQYDLGVIGTGMLSRDLNRWWARVMKKPDPYTRIGQEDLLLSNNGSILALEDVSFTVKRGEAIGIIGPNGAGKSTLLKILSRITAPSSGVVKVKGRIGSLLEVGTGFHPELTGRENVYLNGAILGMRKLEVDMKLDEIVHFAGVEKFIDTPVKRYSSGMYVRLAFAVAAHLDPEIMIVDEVLAVGDIEFQKKCLGKMGDIAGEGRTILFVSHNMAAIETLCKDVYLFESGKLVETGPSKKVINRYLESNQTYGLVKKQSDKLLFLGFPYQTIRIDENINLKLIFKTFDKSFNDVKINIAITNISGDRIIRLQTDLVQSGFELQKEKIHAINFNIDAPFLAPGKYLINIFMQDSNEIIFWSHNISAFTIEPSIIKGHNKLFYDQVGYIMPKFSVNCQETSLEDQS